MTWRQLQRAWPQGRGGIWAIQTNSVGGIVGTRLPLWLGLLLRTLGVGLPEGGVVLVKGALKLPFKRSWLVMIIQEDDEEIVRRLHATGFVGALTIGLAKEAAQAVAEVMKFVEGH